MTAHKLTVLILEDTPADTALVERALREAGVEFATVQTKDVEEFHRLIHEVSPDLIFADHHLAEGECGDDALTASQQLHPAVPFIFLSDTPGEETAVEAVRRGATDYVLKQRAARLSSVVRRALEERHLHPPELSDHPGFPDLDERCRDSHGLCELSRLLCSVREINKLMVRERNPEQLLMQACDILIRSRGYLHVGVGLVSPFLSGLSPVKRSVRPAPYLDSLTINWDKETSSLLPAREAIHSGRSTVYADISSDPRFLPWRERALECGCASLAAIPMMHRGRVVGAITLCSNRAGTFHREEVGLLEELAEDLAFALDCNDRDRCCTAETQPGVHAEEMLRLNCERLLRQESALTTVTKAMTLPGENLITSVQRLTETAARTMGVARASFWRYRASDQALHCVDLFDLDQDRHSEGACRMAVDYPAYFNALAKSDLLGAAAVAEPRTAEFSTDLPSPTNVVSIMDVPVRVRGRLAGVLCHEHAGSGRKWTPDERTFAMALANLAALVIEEDERKELELQFRQAQKMEAVGQLAGGLVHDFNNVLTAVLMHLGILRSTLREPATAEAVKELETQARRASELTRQLLIFSRKSEISFKPLDLNLAAEEMLNMVTRLLGEQVRVVFQRAPDLPLIEGDRSMLQQMILNLALNGRDAMPDGGVLTIATRRTEISTAAVRPGSDQRAGEFVQLSVVDTGCGMNEATRQRIFEPFFTTKEQGKGTGLGLPMVQTIVQQHRGWIEVESVLGKGSSFHVFLPVTEAREIRPAAETPAVVRGGTETILLVEDENHVRLATARRLQMLGYRVIEATDGRMAMRLWAQHSRNIHLLLTDMVMPQGVNGLELARRFCEERPDLKVIVISGYTKEVSARGVPADPKIVFLPKPFETLNLANAVRSCLDQK